MSKQDSTKSAPAQSTIVSLPVEPFTPASLHVQLEIITSTLSVTTKSLGLSNTPESYVLWNLISKLSDLSEHHKKLADQDFDKSQPECELQAVGGAS